LHHLEKVSDFTYGDLIERGTSSADNMRGNTLYLRTDSGSHRPVEITAIKCVDGPAANKYLPVLLDPEKALANGVTLWPVFDISPPPPNPPELIFSRTASQIAHLSWYRIAKRKDGTFEARFEFFSDAEEYVAKHRAPPLAIKLPELLKELENLTKEMSENLSVVRKDHTAKIIHTKTARIGEDRYTAVRAKHGANIERIIEMLEGDDRPRPRIELKQALEEEDSALGAFMQWQDQRDLPPELISKPSGSHFRMSKLIELVYFEREIVTEFGALSVEERMRIRARLREMIFEPWPIGSH
jgi:hypothetical protein